MTALVLRGDARRLPLPDAKSCTQCGVLKDPEEFYKDSSKADGRRPRCIACIRSASSAPASVEARRQYWASEHGREVKRQFRLRNLEKVRAEDRLRRRVAQDRLDAVKLERGCADCGYRKHPAALDFDHRDPVSKTADVSALATHSWANVLAEIEKCDVVCANCHRIRTAASQRRSG